MLFRKKPRTQRLVRDGKMRDDHFYSGGTGLQTIEDLRSEIMKLKPTPGRQLTLIGQSTIMVKNELQSIIFKSTAAFIKLAVAIFGRKKILRNVFFERKFKCEPFNKELVIPKICNIEADSIIFAYEEEVLELVLFFVSHISAAEESLKISCCLNSSTPELINSICSRFVYLKKPISLFFMLSQNENSDHFIYHRTPGNIAQQRIYRSEIEFTNTQKNQFLLETVHLQIVFRFFKKDDVFYLQHLRNLFESHFSDCHLQCTVNFKMKLPDPKGKNIKLREFHKSIKMTNLMILDVTRLNIDVRLIGSSGMNTNLVLFFKYLENHQKLGLSLHVALYAPNLPNEFPQTVWFVCNILNKFCTPDRNKIGLYIDNQRHSFNWIEVFQSTELMKTAFSLLIDNGFNLQKAIWDRITFDRNQVNLDLLLDFEKYGTRVSHCLKNQLTARNYN